MPTADHDIAAPPSRLPWPPILLVGVIVGAVMLGRLAPLPWPGLDDAPARAVGLGLGAAGIVLSIVAILTLRRHATTVRPDASASVLVTSGPYRRLRNPIYLADCLILLGLAEVTKNVWFVAASLAFVLLVTWLAIVPEEHHLETRFGEAYLDYKAKTRRWLVEGAARWPTDLRRERRRAFIDGLKEATGRDLGEWMARISAQGLPDRNDIIDWMRQQGFMFSKASWLERIHHNGGKPIYADSAGKPRVRRAGARHARRKRSAPLRKASRRRRPSRWLQLRRRLRPPDQLEPLLAKAKAYRPLALALMAQIRTVRPGARFLARDTFIAIADPEAFAHLGIGAKGAAPAPGARRTCLRRRGEERRAGRRPWQGRRAHPHGGADGCAPGRPAFARAGGARRRERERLTRGGNHRIAGIWPLPRARGLEVRSWLPMSVGPPPRPFRRSPSCWRSLLASPPPRRRRRRRNATALPI